MDAVKISDGRRVVLKRVRSNSGELDIHRFLSEPQRLEHPRSHAAPLLDEFADTEDPNFTYIVLPLLLYYYRPDFYFVDEVVDFFRQLLEGVQYMHEVGVAHRDCSILNIMMDAGPLYPKGFHPVASILDASGTKRAHRKRRRDVGGVRYYFIDFGISSKFEPGEERKVIGIYGQDDEVPELSISVPYDPFLTDVFIIGNLIRKEFLEKYSNLNFLAPLIERMTEPDPKDRCTSSEAQTIFNRLISEQQRLTLRWRLKEKDSGPVTQFFQDAGTICRESLNIAKGSLATASQNTGHSAQSRSEDMSNIHTQEPKQLLEYMHEVGVAHRDCSILNIMMDAGPLYPKGFHPVASILDASGTKRAHRKRRRDVGGVRYYFIDFGISSKFEPGEERKVIGIYGQDDEVPELSISVPYDPFLTDVFIIGNLIRKEFIEKYTNLTFLAPLIERMTELDPKDRCTSREAQTIFNRLISEQQRLTLRWRLKEKDSGPVTQFFQDAGTICRESLNIAKGSLATASQNTGRALRKPMTPASVYFKNK
ncbi:hypothetical protein A7U60_g4617 [Sanghuangporus baumii]|uniref:Protein kinase domain-containing protein n=1 Tax=Sanghuangporus baumii TaxID=108892 RepID=A0A9Q5HY82_SANBA|nr:hypothetical protein A7U60_g4617 [Sanghuangporus baumii]